MRVTGYNPSDIPGSKTPPTNAPKAEPSAAQAAKKSATDSGVAVVIPSTAKSLGKPTASQAADIDMAKVASVKASIQDGTFAVNPEAIADKLLSNAQDLLKTTLK